MMNDDEKALKLLENAVTKAQTSIEESTTFRPFLMTMAIDGTIKTIENREPTDEGSYALLEESITDRARQNKLEVIVLAIKDRLPNKFSNGKVQSCIRLHIEEQSQLSKSISARFIYIPYTLHRIEGENRLHVNLEQAHPVGFPAEYLS